MNEAPRLASIIAASDCQFGVLRDLIFKDIIKKSIFSEIDDKFKFFKIILRDFCKSKDIFQIAAYFMQDFRKLNEYLVEENSDFDFVYFLKEGRVMIEKKILGKDFNRKTILFNKKSGNYNTFNREIIERSKNFIYGVKELKDNLKKYFFSVKVKKKSILYKINVNNIKKCFEDFPGFKNFMFLYVGNEVKFLEVF